MFDENAGGNIEILLFGEIDVKVYTISHADSAAVHFSTLGFRIHPVNSRGEGETEVHSVPVTVVFYLWGIGGVCGCCCCLGK